MSEEYKRWEDELKNNKRPVIFAEAATEVENE